MTPLDPPITLLQQLIQQNLDQNFLLASVLTFFICEAFFLAGWVKNNGLKILTSIAVGGFWGLILFSEHNSQSIALGMLAGIATTTFVAKFKTNKA